MHRRRRNGKQNKIILFSVMTLLLVMTIGYAAFNTQLNINVKGNVLKGGITTEELKNNAVTSGDGLYADSVTEGRYFYRGATVDNYITFNNETWRIISVESDGTLKIIRNWQLSSTLMWDEAGTRDRTTSTYCANASSYGCNAWAATTNLVSTPTDFTLHYPNGNMATDTTTYSGTVTEDASLNTYLNGDYYNSLTSAAQSQVVTGIFNVSTPGNYTDTETLEVDAEQEKQYRWQGKIALMTVTELLRASTTSGCNSLAAGYNSYGTGYCNSNNWLWPTFNTSDEEWTLSPRVYTSRNHVWFAFLDGDVQYTLDYNSYSVRPVLHLKSDIILSGSGTESDPYQIQ